MADLTVKCAAHEGILEALSEAIRIAKSGDRLVIRIDEAIALQQSFVEQQDELEAQEANGARPLFFYSPENKLFFQPAAIALIGRDPGGNALLNMVNGTNMKIEALEWRRMQPLFEEAVSVVRIPSAGRVVTA